MAKRLRTRDKLLLGIAILGDVSSWVFEGPSLQLGKLKGVLPSDYGNANFTQTVSRMLKTGNLEKVVKNGQAYLRITGVGKKILIRDFPLLLLRPKKWDEIWRIVFYDIPEEQRPKREGLESKLKELGFGMIQKSVYLTPLDVTDDIREFLSENNLTDNVFVTVVKQLFAGDPKALANKIWGLEKINDQYISINQKILERNKVDEIFSDFEKVIRKDPCLPPDLLPTNWMGDKVFREVQKLIKG